MSEIGEDESKQPEDDDGEAEEQERMRSCRLEEFGAEFQNFIEVDQESIDRSWIKKLNINYPCWTYYKTLKKNLLIILQSERIETRKYPKWSENLFSTFSKLKSCVPEIYCVFHEHSLNEQNIMLSAMSLSENLTQW